MFGIRSVGSRNITVTNACHVTYQDSLMMAVRDMCNIDRYRDLQGLAQSHIFQQEPQSMNPMKNMFLILLGPDFSRSCYSQFKLFCLIALIFFFLQASTNPLGEGEERIKETKSHLGLDHLLLILGNGC